MHSRPVPKTLRRRRQPSPPPLLSRLGPIAGLFALKVCNTNQSTRFNSNPAQPDPIVADQPSPARLFSQSNWSTRAASHSIDCRRIRIRSRISSPRQSPCPCRIASHRISSHRSTPRPRTPATPGVDRDCSSTCIEQSSSHRGTNWVGHRQLVLLERPCSPLPPSQCPPSFACVPALHPSAYPSSPVPDRVASSPDDTS